MTWPSLITYSAVQHRELASRRQSQMVRKSELRHQKETHSQADTLVY